MNETQLAQEKRDMERIIHGLLVVGVAISVLLMLTGLILAAILGRPIPTSLATPSEILPRILDLRPSGFMTLGLLALIATPILRVFASIFTFLYEGDWKYALVTFIVFLIVIASILLGRG